MLQMFQTLCVILVLGLSVTTLAIRRAVQPSTRPPQSPCPGLLTYEERDPITARSRWSATIEIRPEQPLRGFTLSVSLDKPAEILGNLVGEVRTKDNKHFSINTRKKLPGGIPFSIRIFVKHSSEVPFIKTIKLNDVQICPQDRAYFQTEPRRALAQPGESVTLLGRAGTPLRYCHFFLPPDNQLIDLSQGQDSLATNEYEYHGRGLDVGECGIRLKQVQDENDGVVECKVKPAGERGQWQSAATTLRVTSLPVQDLPVFDIVPRRKTLSEGDNITVTCNANRPLNMCHIYLPGRRYLNFDLGVDSESTSEYRYHGTGLQNGHCGVTLTGVNDRLNGYLVCKLGRWPEQVTGAWETDALKIQTTPKEDTGTNRETQTGKPLGFTSDPITDSPIDRFGNRRATTLTTSATTEYPRLTPTIKPQGDSGFVECGKTVVQPPVPLINIGQRTYRGQWPWHIALYQSAQNGSLLYACGGSLIGAKTVVTAAHCVTKQPFDRAVDPATLMVYVGRYHLKQWSENGLQERRVARVVVHPNYNRSGFNSDLAVLVLMSDINYTQYVRPICLWDANRTDLNEVEGQEGTVVGWGIDERGQLTEELMKATMPVVSYTTCLWSNPQHFLQFTRATTFCAGFRNGTTVCNGDSGGGMVFPMTTRSGRKWFLRGLVSNSVPMTHEDLSILVCDPRHYVVFTDLAQYLDFLTPFTTL